MSLQDDASEIDIEAVTRGTSLVSNTISYTTQPSVNADGSLITNATFKIPMSPEFNTNLEDYHEHRFDCDLAGGVNYYLDSELKHFDVHNIPQMGGNLQIKLWADGNKWWSGHPSKTTVTMSVKSLIAYFNTSGTEDGTDTTWFDACQAAGGPSDATICKAYAEPGRDDDVPTPGAPSAIPSKVYPGSTPSPKTPILCDGHATGWLCNPRPKHHSQAARLRPLLTYGRAPRSRKAPPKYIPLFPGPHQLPAAVSGNQGARHTLGWMRLARDYLTIGSPVEQGQANRVNLPSWFSMEYARNSTIATYRYLAAVTSGNVRRRRSPPGSGQGC